MIVLYFDGLCLPRNPRGIACYAFVIYRNGEKIGYGSGLAAKPWSDRATNNVAEYMGLLKGLEWLTKREVIDEIRVRGDSKLIIMQMKGVYRVKSKKLKGLHEKCKILERSFRKVHYEWIPRSQNEEADSLARREYEKYIKREWRP